MRHAPRILGIVLGLGLIAAACGSDTTPAGGNGGDTAGGTATVNEASSDLGTILTDDQGLTLYVFLQDNATQSACVDACASTWPALTVQGDASAGDGVDASKLRTLERSDGAVQVTYGGHPLYHYSGDAAPGDINGQGIGNLWFVISPDGQAVKKSASGGGYKY